MSGKNTDHGFDEHAFRDDVVPFPDEFPSEHVSTSHTAEHHSHDESDPHAYSDVHEGDEHEEHEEVVHEEAEESDGNRKSLISRLILPVGGAVLLGVGGVAAWHSGLFGSSDVPPPTTPVASLSAPNSPVTGPRAPAPSTTASNSTGNPILPSGNPPVTGQNNIPPRNASLPNTGTVQLPPMGITSSPAQQPSFTTPPTIPAQSQPVQPVATPTTQPPSVVRDTGNQTVQPEILNSLNSLITEMQVSNRNAAASSAVTVEIRSMREAMMGKFDTLGTQVGTLSGRIDAVDGKISGIETRVAALETRAPVKPQVNVPVINQPVTSNNPPATPQSPIVRVPVKPARHTRQIHQPERMPEIRLPATTGTPASMSSYKLIGASRDSALVETPQGLVQVAIGKPLPNGAVTKGFRQEGDNWILVTGSGEVRP